MLDKDGLFEVSTTDDMKSAYTKEKAMEDISGLLETRIVGNGYAFYAVIRTVHIG